MHSFTVLVLGFLAFGSRAVLSLDFQLHLSQVQQCQPVTFNITGLATAKTIPKWITIVPFNATPIAIPLPTIPQTESGAFSGYFSSIIPLAAGTNFVASLDDSTGENLARVSDTFRVLPSANNDVSCMPMLSVQSRRYTFNDTLTQCGIFGLTYDTTVTSSAPKVRVYNPTGASRLLNLTADDPSSGVATYLMSFSRSKQIVMLFDDNHGHRETSPLLTVGGDTSTNSSCLNVGTYTMTGSNDDGNDSDQSSASSAPKVSRAIIIGSAIAGGSILSVAVCLFAFIIRERRKRRSQQRSGDPEFVPATLSEKGFVQVSSGRNSPITFSSPPESSLPGTAAARNSPSPQPQLRNLLLRPSPSPVPSSRASPSPLPDASAWVSPRPSPISPAVTSPVSIGSAEIVRNPVYTSMGSDNIYSPGSSYRTRDSLASWAQPLPEENHSPRSTHTVIPNRDHMSLNSLDIEGMLNAAASQSSRSSQQSDPAPHNPASISQATLARRPSSPTIPRLEPAAVTPTVIVSTPPSSAGLKRWPSRGHLRPPSDVPKGPVSMTFSSISADPFNDENASVNLNLSSPFVSPRTTLLERTVSFESAIQFPPEALLGLPKSPRDGPGVSPTSPRLFVLREREREQNNSSPSLASSGDVNYGIAQ